VIAQSNNSSEITGIHNKAKSLMVNNPMAHR
jgi:hypothetical protein